ncbi:putative signal peptide protein [Puccinia sorghi]|uniref:Putative signal peptide protein n=1 Tax=Puccinia sorghi TaxID=27349 RepID=A0A0L6V841_9BASI|nr:putative signal peptide protein [Puccinia sorghi]
MEVIFVRRLFMSVLTIFLNPCACNCLSWLSTNQFRWMRRRKKSRRCEWKKSQQLL